MGSAGSKILEASRDRSRKRKEKKAGVDNQPASMSRRGDSAPAPAPSGFASFVNSLSLIQSNESKPSESNDALISSTKPRDSTQLLQTSHSPPRSHDDYRECNTPTKASDTVTLAPATPLSDNVLQKEPSPPSASASPDLYEPPIQQEGHFDIRQNSWQPYWGRPGAAPPGSTARPTLESIRFVKSTHQESSPAASCDLVHSSYAAAAIADHSSSAGPSTNVKITVESNDTTGVPKAEPEKGAVKKSKKRNKMPIDRSALPGPVVLDVSQARNPTTTLNQRRSANDFDRGFGVSGHRRINAKRFNEHWKDFVPADYR